MAVETKFCSCPPQVSSSDVATTANRFDFFYFHLLRPAKTEAWWW
jgi:hypothetical protein